MLAYAGKSNIHEQGLFAQTAIPAGSRIIQYTGERITKAESLLRCERENCYIFTLDDEFDVDGSATENLARFANHSCSPNAESELSNGEIWIVALRDIAPGEEITYNYGYDLEEYRDYPCRCGSPNCAGYMVAEDLFPLVRRE
jgi:SET domain-containing protein